MNPLSLITSALGGVWGYVAAAALSAVLVGSGVGYVVHRMDAATLSDLKLSDAQAQIAAVKVAYAAQLAQDKVDADAAVAEQAAQDALRVKTVTVTKEIPRYVTRHQDAVVCIPFGLVRLLDAEVLGTDPAALALAAGQSDDTCSAVKASDLAGSVIANYGAAIANAQQLTALQQWARDNHQAQGASQ